MLGTEGCMASWAKGKLHVCTVALKLHVERGSLRMQGSGGGIVCDGVGVRQAPV